MKVDPPMVKTRFCRLANCELEILSRPVALSKVAPVALLYLLNASVRCHQNRASGVDPERLTGGDV